MKRTNNTTTSTSNTTAKTDKQTAFEKVIADFEKQAIAKQTASGYNASEYTTALLNLATACCYSVLKKCIIATNTASNKPLTLKTASGNNAIMLQFRRDIAKAISDQKATAYIDTYNRKTEYTKDGDRKTAIIDTITEKDGDKITADTIGDGYELVNIAIVSILEQTEKAIDRNGELTQGYILQAYEHKALNRKIYIKSIDNVNYYKTETTTALQQVFKAIRRYIEDNRKQTATEKGYTYLEYTTTSDTTAEYSDTADTDGDRIYKRLPKYINLGASGTNSTYSGTPTYYTTQSDTADKVDRLIEKMALTDRQAQILQLRLQGYGLKAIATYLGISHQAVAKTLKAIQDKATASGLKMAK